MCDWHTALSWQLQKINAHFCESEIWINIEVQCHPLRCCLSRSPLSRRARYWRRASRRLDRRPAAPPAGGAPTELASRRRRRRGCARRSWPGCSWPCAGRSSQLPAAAALGWARLAIPHSTAPSLRCALARSLAWPTDRRSMAVRIRRRRAAFLPPPHSSDVARVADAWDHFAAAHFAPALSAKKAAAEADVGGAQAARFSPLLLRLINCWKHLAHFALEHSHRLFYAMFISFT